VREAEASPLLEAVTRDRLLKTLQVGDDLVFAAVICIAWRLAVALQLFVVPSRVNKSQYPIHTPSTVTPKKRDGI
jgi:hypothetical protein